MGTASQTKLVLQEEIQHLRVRIAELERERQIPSEIIQNSPVMISIVRGPDFVYELVNPAFQALAPGKNFVGRRFADVWSEVPDPLIEILRNVFATGRTFKLEDAPYTIQRGPGAPPEEVYVSYSWIPLPGADGKGDRILTLAHETTEQVRQRQQLAEANKSLREREAVLRGFFDSPGQMRGIVELVDGVIVHVSCNDAAAKMFGVARESIAGKFAAQAGASADVAQKWVGLYQESRSTGKPVSMEYFRRDADGQERWLLATASYLGTRPAGYPRFAYTALDLTERKRAEEALAVAIQRLDAHMDNSPLAVIEFDPQFRVTRWSKEAERMFGWTAAEILGRSIVEMPWVHEDDVEAVSRVSQDMLTGKCPRNLNTNRNYRKDGSSVECEWYNSAIYDSEGSLKSILSQVLDVTDRKRGEERLRQAQKLESLGLLAGGVAHDFNNLLVGVIGNASLAREILPPDHPAAELLDGVLKTGEQAAHLTRQMLAYSGKGRFVVEPLDLSALIPEMSGLVRPSIRKKIALRLNLDHDLPAIEADRGQIQQVFMNLVLNAGEAIGSHDGLITVRTRVEDVDERYARLHGESAALAPGKYVCLEVRDTGCGMDEATKARIFDPFFSTKFIGRGLGLAAVSGIVRGHNGAIRVSSVPGQGSCFTVLFPALAHAAEKPADRARAAVLQGTGTVLVVDDEQVVREIAKRALKRHGYKVLVADSGLAAIDVFRRHPGEIALVVLDLSMPHMNGEEALPELRKIRPAVKVMVSSGYSEPEAMALFQGQRISGFVQKPYTSSGLAEKVKACIG